MSADGIRYEILKDGTIRWETDSISSANHTSAERFLAEVGRLLGGEEKIERKTAHSHSHQEQGHKAHAW